MAHDLDLERGWKVNAPFTPSPLTAGSLQWLHFLTESKQLGSSLSFVLPPILNHTAYRLLLRLLSSQYDSIQAGGA